MKKPMRFVTDRFARLAGYLIAVALLSLLSMAGHAACYVSSGFPPQDVQMDWGRVLIQPDLPVGAVIQTLQRPITGKNNAGYCNYGGFSRGEFVRNPAAVPGFSNVYQTDVPGVGIRVYREAGNISTYYPHQINFSGNRQLNLIGGYFKVDLVKTAAVTGAGPIGPPGLFTTYYLDGSGINRPVLTSTLTGQGVTIVTSSCQVDAGSKNIAVNFGSVSNRDFSGVGSRVNPRDFEIRMRCQGGNVAGMDQGLIKVRFDGTRDVSNLPGVLAIDAGPASASGIGIQLNQTLGGTEQVVTLGEGVALGRTPINDSAEFVLPMRAYYIQTQSGTVGAGTGNGRATFTIEYH